MFEIWTSSLFSFIWITDRRGLKLIWFGGTSGKHGICTSGAFVTDEEGWVKIT